jgi:hypothetical protein
MGGGEQDGGVFIGERRGGARKTSGDFFVGGRTVGVVGICFGMFL